MEPLRSRLSHRFGDRIWLAQHPYLAEGFAGATVLKGVIGFGAHRIYHTHKLLKLSVDLPMVVEVVESQEKIDAIMPKVDAIMESGMITLEKATVIRYTHRHENE